MAGRIELWKPGPEQARSEQKYEKRDGQYQTGIVPESRSDMEMQQLVQRPLRSAPGTFQPCRPVKRASGEKCILRIVGSVDINGKKSGNGTQCHADSFDFRVCHRINTTLPERLPRQQ